MVEEEEEEQEGKRKETIWIDDVIMFECYYYICKRVGIKTHYQFNYLIKVL